MPVETLLQQTLDQSNLREAWEEVAANKGMPGVDDVSILAWQRGWEERLVNLAREVRGNRYKPRKLRLIRIPKKNPGEFRTLRIPTVTDRVLQRAVSQVLQPVYEKMFLDCSYGYRPGRSLKDALARILAWRDAGYIWVLDADIDQYFDQIDHELLLRFLQADLPDESLLPLISAWLAAAKSARAQSVGVPMGSPLSPLLANLFLHRLDCACQGRAIPLVRYADDFICLCREEDQLQPIYETVRAELENLSLRYQPKKTRLTSFEEGFTFVGIHFLRCEYAYTWEDKKIVVSDPGVDWAFGQYLPEYQ